jgi:2-succinyl-5-enolpyruvyl-6-hydroxy-3-cyclohexene-1-carboxylate synthase
VLAVALANEQEETAPQLLITIGHQVISKKIKAFLRKTSLIAHWHIDTSPAPADTYQQLSHFIPVLPETFFKQLNANYQPPTSAYYQHWNSFRELATKRHHAFLEQAPFSDLQAFDQLLTAIPENTHIQMGNSSTVRYIQLFDQQQGAHYFSNRGTSGIEGSVSTAVGATWATKHQTVLIVGDLSFLYDQNGLWNNYLTPALKIIVINNAGGGIFRFIDGPDTVKDFETYLETSHKRNIEPVAQMYGLHYFCAKTKEELKNQLPLFFASQATTTSVLEVCTPRLENATLLKSYFHHLTHGK